MYELGCIYSTPTSLRGNRAPRRVVEFLWEGGQVKGRDQVRWTAAAREAPHIPITAKPAATAKQVR
jgi:hypothetical protein